MRQNSDQKDLVLLDLTALRAGGQRGHGKAMTKPSRRLVVLGAKRPEHPSAPGCGVWLQRKESAGGVHLNYPQASGAILRSLCRCAPGAASAVGMSAPISPAKGVSLARPPIVSFTLSSSYTRVGASTVASVAAVVLVRGADMPTICWQCSRRTATSLFGWSSTPRSTTQRPAPASIMHGSQALADVARIVGHGAVWVLR